MRFAHAVKAPLALITVQSICDVMTPLFVRQVALITQRRNGNVVGGAAAHVRYNCAAVTREIRWVSVSTTYKADVIFEQQIFSAATH